MELLIYKYIIMALIGATGGFGIIKNLCSVWQTWINRRSEERQLKLTHKHEIEIIKMKRGMKKKKPPD